MDTDPPRTNASVVGFNQAIPFDPNDEIVGAPEPQWVLVRVAAEDLRHLPIEWLQVVPRQPEHVVFPVGRPARTRGVAMSPQGRAAVDHRLLATLKGETPQAPPASTRPVPHHDYYDQHTSPLPKRRYLALARERAFPCFKVGKQVLALRGDVEEYIASRAVMGRPSPSPPPPDEVDDVLARAGLQRKR